MTLGKRPQSSPGTWHSPGLLGKSMILKPNHPKSSGTFALTLKILLHNNARCPSAQTQGALSPTEEPALTSESSRSDGQRMAAKLMEDEWGNATQTDGGGTALPKGACGLAGETGSVPGEFPVSWTKGLGRKT